MTRYIRVQPKPDLPDVSTGWWGKAVMVFLMIVSLYLVVMAFRLGMTNSATDPNPAQIHANVR